ncbi:glycoside hydrolase family 15 protein [Thermophagus xiamenensis]|uniref:Glucoamylase (Glucan-1,4-alpha-glucosidase), GH15 family n=1 Tax=Thermophagus xiamenensis TaxID=385682 RepID=A0A1I2BGB4_9BACT|nr:glycoside hydrolase family 15 protein [Thermophagus xiamenensis]SFE55166.1 Glucoamylase (glucan-1,4-alpha-glucosidase), GH15 family [Thermophagus xiamenensis]
MNNLNYGIVGNGKSAALISEKGSVDWLCFPQFDSPSVFAALLDKEKGGHFSIISVSGANITQKYGFHSNILITRFECVDGTFEIHDFMPRYKSDNGTYYIPPDLIRYIKWIKGKPKIKILYDPRLEYAKFDTRITIHEKYVKAQTTKGSYDSLYLYTSMDKLAVVGQLPITLEKDEFILISYNQKLLVQTIERAYLKLQRTKVYWLNWSERTTRFKKYNDQILRSALVLKLLSYQKSGAILAALTTSLPETIGEERNWDYRFCWIRDASMVIKVMTMLGHFNVAHRYLNFIINLLPDKDEKIQIMYGINGEKKLTEYELPHLSGYENSKPVRIGNAAYKQKQNDIYGILVDVIYQLFHLFTTSLEHSEELWTITRNIIKVVQKNWQKPDKGIWEIRHSTKHFTFSKVLCWVAVDRGIKIAELLHQKDYIRSWERLREKIKVDILKNAWSEEKQAFTQSYDSNDLDASVLLMETYGFIEGDDPRYKSTVKAIQRELEHNGLMFRYRNYDGFGQPSSAFTICSFWLIRALYKIGEKEEAKKKFEQLLKYSNHLGLFSEDMDFETKRLLGNFPQAYSHLALIDVAMLLAGGELTTEEKILGNIG